nr:DNA directed RNA polymerase I subunit RPA2 [Hymenolepis microstoma]
MQRLSRAHVDSFNFAVKVGLKRMLEYLHPVYFTVGDEEYSLSIEHLEIGRPMDSNSKSKLIYPHECRRNGESYSGTLKLSIRIRSQTVDFGTVDLSGGTIPVMVMSDLCNLSKLPRSEFYKVNEEAREIGGYFIVNGNEKVLRMIIMARRNYPIAVSRASFKKRGIGFTEHCIIMRCVREDETGAPVMLHWVTNGEPVLAFTVENEQVFVPVSVLLRALVDKTDFEIFEDIIRGGRNSLSLEEHAIKIVTRYKDEEYFNQARTLRHIGRIFRLKMHLSKRLSDLEVGEHLLSEYVLIHTKSFFEKYHILCFMIRKLHTFVSDGCCVENNDNLMFQEVLLPGTQYLQLLRNRLITYLHSAREQISMVARRATKPPEYSHFRQALNRTYAEVTSNMTTFIMTGNLPGTSRAVLGRLLNGQSTGLSVTVDTINFLRFAAQFRAVHRGAVFMEMRTTSVRRLQPEAYGFICPVNTPDGSPCGLLNHLAKNTEVVTETPSDSILDNLAQWLREHYVRPVELLRQLMGQEEHRKIFPILLDGRLVGWSPSGVSAKELARTLRVAKLDENCSVVPSNLEICFVPPTNTASQYPGLYLFLGASRLLRPVYSYIRTGGRNWDNPEIEMIGTFEQPYMDIPVTQSELLERYPNDRLHREISPEDIFSFIASLTPFCDFNQSPRNLYQCQMSKQSIAFSSYSYMYRSDPKFYRLLSPQSPLVRTKTYVDFGVDHYPVGFNAVVAVISYTGYDMEDAMVINKASYDRGFADACVYRTEIIDLRQYSAKNRRAKEAEHYFGGNVKDLPPNIDIDGLPRIGAKLIPGKSIFYAYTHKETKKTTTVVYKDQLGYVDSISNHGVNYKVTITLRIPRRPDIGDKYSSRHGQKGINSILMSPSDLPFSANTGMIPDLIFNPHGFPTRMTVGMLIEFLAGKTSALTGNFIDATPFQWNDEIPPYLEYGKLLEQLGFDYHGNESMISGITGRPIEAHIYMGVVYYQRLRHMVADKFQVRAEGRYDPEFRQPIKGRKVGGGIRLGEMERDCLISQGLSFTLHDRLVRAEGRYDPEFRQPIKGRKVGGGIRLGEMERDCLISQGLSFTLHDRLVSSNCDRVKMFVCSNCNGIIHADLMNENQPNGSNATTQHQALWSASHWRCRLCNQAGVSGPDSTGNKLSLVEVPAVFRHLTYELACLNVQTKLDAKDST